MPSIATVGDGASSANGRRRDAVLWLSTHWGALDARRPWWDYPTMVITLDAKRRLTVPIALAPAKPGDVFEADFDAEEDAIIFRRISRSTNWVSVLEECPVPMDDLPSRRREYFRSKL